MGGRVRAKSWFVGFPPPSRRSPVRLRTRARLRGPSTGPLADGQSIRPRDPPDLRCRLSRHRVRSVQPVSRLDFLSWDCPKIAPPSSWQLRSPLPARPSRGLPSGGACHGTSAFRPRGFPPPRRFPPPKPGACIATRSRPWGSPRFPFASVQSPGRRLPVPGMPSLPFEAFPPSAAASGSSSDLARTRGRQTVPEAGWRHRRVATPFTALLASSPFSSPAPDPSPRSPARACPGRFGGDLEAFLHERVRCGSGGCPPTSPGAPLGLPGAIPPPPPRTVGSASCPGGTSKTASRPRRTRCSDPRGRAENSALGPDRKSVV